MPEPRTYVLGRVETRSPSRGVAKTHHVCLAGPRTSGDWDLIVSLKERNQVTVLERLSMLGKNRILERASVLLLDCQQGLRPGTVRGLKASHPGLQIVLVNGQLAAVDVAGLFREGARDYFPADVEARLIVERVEYLCRSEGARQAAAETV